MDPDQVEIVMNECCDEEDEDGCIPYESRFKIEIFFKEITRSFLFNLHS